jgi:predicted RNA-binding protein with PIN domain
MGEPTRVLLVDGYNVINRVPELRASLAQGLENARLRLAIQVSAWTKTHPATASIIVFDGEDKPLGGREQTLAGVRCLFTATAHGGDDALIRLTREHRTKEHDVTVVSDDNNVGNNCRAHGATVRTTSFLMRVDRAPASPRFAGKASDKGISRKAATEIDAELRKKFGV